MENRNPAQVFGEVAGDYDRVRPAYPAALFDDVLSYGQPDIGGRRALEVGAGTGRATEAFAAKGLPVVAVEPDDAMADLLAGRVARFSGVQVVRGSFEEFRPAERFGLLFSAEAWHWTLPETRWYAFIWARVTQGEPRFAPRPIEAQQPPHIQREWLQRRGNTWHHLSREAPLAHYAALKNILTHHADLLIAKIDL